jgi:hypothetical protein
VRGRQDENAPRAGHQLDGALSPCSTSYRRINNNVRKRRDRKSEAHFKKPKRNYRQSNEDQIQPGSHKEESSHNSKKSGQPQYHPQEPKTDSGFAKKVGRLPLLLDR